MAVDVGVVECAGVLVDSWNDGWLCLVLCGFVRSGLLVRDRAVLFCVFGTRDSRASVLLLFFSFLYLYYYC